MRFTIALLASLVGTALANPAPVTTIEDNEGLEERTITITADIPAGNIIGAKSLLGTETFNGIPYAYPPTGDRRLRPPTRYNETLSQFDATSYAPACPQFLADTSSNNFISKVITDVTRTPLFRKALKVSENCLTLDVSRPAGTKAGDNLPVLFWMYGGGFTLGWSSMYDGSSLVKAATEHGKPYIFVAVNYRVGGFGFLAGKEILADGAANLGHLDQRMGLEWVADNIQALGGDPSKVTIWGESAGAVSVFNQMTLYDGNNVYNGKPLFRGAIMNSGSIIPFRPTDARHWQEIYDQVVSTGGCSSSPDTLKCLRELPYERYLEAANSVPALLSATGIAVSYAPTPDGKVLTDRADKLIAAGKYAAVPMIIGDQEDEGTLFSLVQSGQVGTTDSLVHYLKSNFFDTTHEILRGLVDTYPTDITAGSPFRSWIFNEIYPGYKRFAALIGDYIFTLQRRIFLRLATTKNPNVPAWSYIASYDFGLPIMGTFHASDILQVFYGILPNYASKGIQSYYANFIYNLDPNDTSGGTGAKTKVKEFWPQWDNTGKKLIQFYGTHFTFMTDTFRADSEKYLSEHLDELSL